MTHTVWTIGHSTRPIEEFLALLRDAEITSVADVRRYPGSRRHPQFNREALTRSLSDNGIDYLSLPELGGRREPRENSTNNALRNAGFRGYADYMQSPEFADNVQRVAELATTERCALMCAEAVPWRCHRSLIGDALLVRGVRVEDIIGPGKRKPHTLTTFAHVDGLQITYPPAVDALRQTTLVYATDQSE